MRSVALGIGLLLFAWGGLALSSEEESDGFVTYDNLPMGSPERPFVLRTYFPDPGLAREVLSNHGLGRRARNYSPGRGDVEGFDDPVTGIPGAIGVNFGPGLSICWDTTECRLLYAWQGGFLDMTNYWGSPDSGRRTRFGYVPELVGQLIYRAQGDHPLAIFATFTDAPAPRYRGYRLVEGVPEFSYALGDALVHVLIEPGDEPMTIRKRYRIEGADEFDYFEAGYRFETSKVEDGSFEVVIRGRSIDSVTVEEEPEYSTEVPNTQWGEALYTMLGCIACHSLDGTRGHGPSFSGVYGSERPITGLDEPVDADAAYLRESIVNPMAKVVDGFPPGYMPPYPIEDDQIESLILFIQSFGNE